MTEEQFWQILMDWGYLAIMISVAIEGEILLIISGIAVAAGIFSYPLAILAAFVGAIIHDNTIFYISRFTGAKIIRKKASWHTKANLALKFLDKHDYWAILSVRFLYGFRTIAIFVIGLSNTKGLKFFTLDAISSLVWSTIYISLGLFFGRAILNFIDNSNLIHTISDNKLISVLVLVIAISVVYFTYKLIVSTLRGRNK